MYVCICNAVTEGDIRELVADGLNTLNEIQAVTGCAGSCGTCSDYAEAVIARARRETAIPCRLPMADPLAQSA